MKKVMKLLAFIFEQPSYIQISMMCSECHLALEEFNKFIQQNLIGIIIIAKQ